MRAKSEILAWFLVADLLAIVFFMSVLAFAEPGREEGQGRMVVPGAGQKVITAFLGAEVTVPAEVPDRENFVPMGAEQKDGLIMLVFRRADEMVPVYFEAYAPDGSLVFIVWITPDGQIHGAYDRDMDVPGPFNPTGVFVLKVPPDQEKKPVEPKKPDPKTIHFSI